MVAAAITKRTIKRKKKDAYADGCPDFLLLKWRSPFYRMLVWSALD